MDQKQSKILNEKYQKISQIGEGSGGKIYLYQNIKDQQYVVIKKFIYHGKQQNEQIMQEIKYMQKFDHLNIIKAFDYFSKKKQYGDTSDHFIVMDMLTDIKDINSKMLSVQQLRFIGKQLLQGLQHLHDQNILHRDIKPSNMFIDKNGNVKIGDFGLMRQLEEDKQKQMTGNIVTRLYRPPEIFYGEKSYNQSIDIWSMGVTIAELFVEWEQNVKEIDQYLFNGSSEIDTLQKIFEVRGTPNEQNWPGCSDLPIFMEFEHMDPKDICTVIPKLPKEGGEILEKMMSLDPKQRPSAQECLNHPFFKDAPDSQKELQNIVKEKQESLLKSLLKI